MGQKTASRIFLAEPLKTHLENATQTLGTHQENYCCGYDFASGCAVAPNSVTGTIASTDPTFGLGGIGTSTTTSLQILGRIVEDRAALGTQHTFLVVTGDNASVLASAQPSKKINLWGEVKNFFGFDQGVFIQPQGLTPTASSREYGKYINEVGQDPSRPYQSNVIIVNQSYTQVVDQINRFNAAVRDSHISYSSTSQNSNSYTFTLMQYLTGTNPGSTLKAPGSGTRLSPNGL